MGSERVRARRPRIVAAVMVLAALAPSRAFADPSAADRETARTLMKQGDERFAAKDYAAALKAYQSAHAIMQVPTTGLAVAKALVERKQLVEARDTLLQVARLPKESNEPSALGRARDEASSLAQRLADRIPSVVITVQGGAEGLEVQVDGDTIPHASLGAPRKVNPGSHTITALAGGNVIATANVTLKEGENETVLLKPTGPRLALKRIEGGGVIHIVSPSEPGNLFLDGKAVGVTPLDVPASAGKHELEIEYPGGTHDSQSVEVTKDGTVEVTFAPSRLDASARFRKGVHFGISAGPSQSVYFGEWGVLYGGTANFVLNVGITPMFDFRGLAGVSYDYRGDGPRQIVTATLGALLKVNYTTWFSFAAGLSGGFVTGFDGAQNPNRTDVHVGYGVGPEWSPFILSAGDKRQFELGFVQGIRFGTLGTYYHQAVVLTVLLLK